MEEYLEVFDSINFENEGECPPLASKYVVASMAPSTNKTIDSEHCEEKTAFVVKQNIERVSRLLTVFLCCDN